MRVFALACSTVRRHLLELAATRPIQRPSRFKPSRHLPQPLPLLPVRASLRRCVRYAVLANHGLVRRHVRAVGHERPPHFAPPL